MYLLYLDESGNESDPVDRFFVLGGIALFERQTFFLVKAIEAIQEKYFPNHQPIPFHASEIRSGRDFWRKVAPETPPRDMRCDRSCACQGSLAVCRCSREDEGSLG